MFFFFIMITTIDNCEDFPSQTRTKPVWNLAFCQMTFINIKHQHQGCLGLSGILTLTYALNYLEGPEKKLMPGSTFRDPHSKPGLRHSQDIGIF